MIPDSQSKMGDNHARRWILTTLFICKHDYTIDYVWQDILGKERNIVAKIEIMKQKCDKMVMKVKNEPPFAMSMLGHGRLIFRMADFWRALCEQSVGREKENKKKFGLLDFFSDM